MATACESSLVQNFLAWTMTKLGDLCCASSFQIAVKLIYKKMLMCFCQHVYFIHECSAGQKHKLIILHTGNCNNHREQCFGTCAAYTPECAHKFMRSYKLHEICIASIKVSEEAQVVQLTVLLLYQLR